MIRHACVEIPLGRFAVLKTSLIKLKQYCDQYAVLRRQARSRQVVLLDPDAESAEARVVLGEEYREVLAALRRLPDRQREAVALRYCLDLPVDEVAAVMGISPGTVKSATSRGIAAITRTLKGDS